MTESRIVTLPSVASYLKIHNSTVYRLLKAHRLPAFKVGRDWRFDLDEIDKWRHEGGTNGVHQ